jgi:hypothetical protein
MRFSAVLLAMAAIGAPCAASAQVSVNINVPGLVTMAPPPPRVEYVPAPQPGRVWVPGRWSWNDRAYAWRPGYWQRARADYDYAPGRWVAMNGGYRWVEGDWRRHGGKQERHDHHDHGKHGHDDDHGHCPPGQAKKGRC